MRLLFWRKPTAFELARKSAKDNCKAQVLSLQDGDVLVCKLGIKDMGDGLPPWIPGPTELESVRDDLDLVFSDIDKDVRVLIHHMGIDFEIIRGVGDIKTVKVESIAGFSDRPA